MQYLYDPSTANCGPASLGAATVLGTAAVLASWGGTFRGNRSDSPLHHSRCLRSLNLGQRIITCGDILAGRGVPDKTVILLHGLDGNATLHEHWGILAPITPVPGAPEKRIHLYLGLVAGQVHWYTHERFADLYHEGVPTCCAYVPGEGDIPNLDAWQRLYCWATTL